jgi:hypothetical protein
MGNLEHPTFSKDSNQGLPESLYEISKVWVRYINSCSVAQFFEERFY